VITEIDNGIIAECNSAGDEGTCTFVNVRGLTSTAIPTLSELGMIAAVVGLMLAGVIYMVYRKRAAKAE
jgi:hypothetical protein